MPTIDADRLGPSLPERDQARVAELLPTPAAAETVGEDVRKGLIAVADRVRAEMRGGELTEALAVLHHLRTGLGSLRPVELIKRPGFRPFDNRNRRLKAFRARFGEATRTLSESLDDLQVRIGAINRRSGVMENLWAEMRGGVVHADTVCAAAFHSARGHTAEALNARGHRLADARDAALRVLPQVRVAQNADGVAAHRLKLACDAMLDWHHEWSHALGMKAIGARGKAPKVVKPDQNRLATSRDTVLAMLDAAAREVAIARRRRLDADARIEVARRAI